MGGPEAEPGITLPPVLVEEGTQKQVRLVQIPTGLFN